jgi:hypothetical protein
MEQGETVGRRAVGCLEVISPMDNLRPLERL